VVASSRLYLRHNLTIVSHVYYHVLECSNTWAAFVGVFVALISRGRKLWELALYAFVIPVVYCLIWFTAWGGIALRQSRQALELRRLGEQYFNNSGNFLVDGSQFCHNVPQQDIEIDGRLIFTNRLLGVTPVCRFDSENWNTAAFKVLYSFSFPDTFAGAGLGPCLTILMIVAAAVYYVSSSDSACLIVDSWASNGRRKHHWARRMFWTLTVGAMATALLSMGGEDALTAVKAASIVCGLPITILLCYVLQSIVLFCQAAEQLEEPSTYKFPNQPEFSMPIYGGIFNVMEYITSMGSVNKARVELAMHRPTSMQVVEFVRGLFVPFLSFRQILVETSPEAPFCNALLAVLYMVCYLGWIALWILLQRRHLTGLYGLRYILFGAAGVMLGTFRRGYRKRYNLRSNIFGDYMASWFFWPQVLAQMQLHQRNLKDEQERRTASQQKQPPSGRQSKDQPKVTPTTVRAM
jgi:BCCT, betaine/carnitine/choline family transporter